MCATFITLARDDGADLEGDSLRFRYSPRK